MFILPHITSFKKNKNKHEIDKNCSMERSPRHDEKVSYQTLLFVYIK